MVEEDVVVVVVAVVVVAVVLCALEFGISDLGSQAGL